MGCSKNGSKREVHSNTGLLQETGKITPESNLNLKELEKIIVAQNFRRKKIKDKNMKQRLERGIQIQSISVLHSEI